MSYDFAWSKKYHKVRVGLFVFSTYRLQLCCCSEYHPDCEYYDIQDSGIIALVIFINAPRFVPKNPPNSKLTVTHFLSWHISTVYINLVVTMYDSSCVDPCGH